MSFKLCARVHFLVPRLVHIISNPKPLFLSQLQCSAACFVQAYLVPLCAPLTEFGCVLQFASLILSSLPGTPRFLVENRLCFLFFFFKYFRYKTGARVHFLRHISNPKPVVCIIAFETSPNYFEFHAEMLRLHSVLASGTGTYISQNCICVVDKHVCILIIKFDFARLRVHKTNHANSRTYTQIIHIYTSMQCIPSQLVHFHSLAHTHAGAHTHTHTHTHT